MRKPSSLVKKGLYSWKTSLVYHQEFPPYPQWTPICLHIELKLAEMEDESPKNLV